MLGVSFPYISAMQRLKKRLLSHFFVIFFKFLLVDTVRQFFQYDCSNISI